MAHLFLGGGRHVVQRQHGPDAAEDQGRADAGYGADVELPDHEVLLAVLDVEHVHAVDPLAETVVQPACPAEQPEVDVA